MSLRIEPPYRISLAGLLALLLLLGCGGGGSNAPATGGPSSVVDVGWLAARLDGSEVQVVDARTQAGEFEAGHIPGAVRLDPFEMAADVGGVQAQILPLPAAGPILRERGVQAGRTVVVYGKAPEYDPARVAWALLYYGVEDVRYLDGGWEAWQGSGEPIETGPSRTSSSSFEPGTNDAIRVTGDWLLEQLGPSPYDEPAVQIVDVRSPGEYAAGHVPAARLLPWSDNLEGGLLKSREEIQALHEGLDPSTTTVVYCTAGWRASLGWLAMRWLGFEDVRVYDGSWLEWGADARFPVESGD